MAEEEVDSVMQQAERAGATVVKKPQKTFWGGYSGCFADPDGHLWEIAYNPSLLPDDEAEASRASDSSPAAGLNLSTRH